MQSDTKGRATKLIEEGERTVGDPVPLTTPIYETSTFVFDNAQEVVAFNEGRSSKYIYSRYGNPTVVSVERQLAVLEDAEAALLFGSGMGAAATILMALLKAGDEVICASAIYGGTLHLLQDLLGNFGVTTNFVSLDVLRNLAPAFTDRTKLVWFESPTNPVLRCVDIKSVTAACRSHGVLSVFDNTFASPINQRPLALGVDLSMQSATKYLNGHSDLTAGVVTGSKTLIERVAMTRRLVGAVIEAHGAYALGRGLKTLAIRIARQNATAQAVAEFFARDRRVSRVYYPGLADHPDHAVARQQMTGFGGMVCVDLDGRFDRAERVYDRLKIIRRATSLGGVESLVSLPILTSQWGCTDEQLAAAGVTKGMLRLSIGLEDADDLIADLDQALAG